MGRLTDRPQGLSRKRIAATNVWLWPNADTRVADIAHGAWLHIEIQPSVPGAA